MFNTVYKCQNNIKTTQNIFILSKMRRFGVKRNQTNLALVKTNSADLFAELLLNDIF